MLSQDEIKTGLSKASQASFIARLFLNSPTFSELVVKRFSETQLYYSEKPRKRFGKLSEKFRKTLITS